MDVQEKLRSSLKEEFELRQLKNPRYSLRSFARYLGVAPASLCGILNGKRNITRRMANKWLTKALPSFSAQDLSSLRDRNEPLSLDTSEYRVLRDRSFGVLENWHDFAIIALIDTQDFESDPAWISERLGITASDAQNALKRLRKHRIIGKDRTNGCYYLTGQQVTTGPHTPHAQIRRSHVQNLELASQSVLNISPEERDMSFITVAMNPKRIPEARKRIEEFRRNLSKWLESDEDRTEVYRLSIQLFPLTQKKKDDK